MLTPVTEPGGLGPAYTSSLLPSLNTTSSPLPNAFHASLVKVSAVDGRITLSPGGHSAPERLYILQFVISGSLYPYVPPPLVSRLLRSELFPSSEVEEAQYRRYCTINVDVKVIADSVFFEHPLGFPFSWRPHTQLAILPKSLI